MASDLPPPLQHLLAAIPEELVWIQVLIRRQPTGFELRHVDDRAAQPEPLRSLEVSALRTLALRDGSGAFRPLRCAPNLPTGWRCSITSPLQLAEALHLLYPGTLPDWWAFETDAAKPVTFETIAGQQLGRAGALRNLPPESVAALTAAACNPRSCLKHRRWTATGVAGDDGQTKSRVPCLEPCPLFLTFARTCAETERQPSVPVELTPDDLATLAAALRHAILTTPAGVRPGDIAEPLHPWRIARLLARHKDTWNRAATPSPSSDE